jgi:manganese/zinc/iron transport system permease protein
MITVILGLVFLLAALISPRKGLVAQFFRRRTQSRRFAAEMLVVHLLTHEGTAEEPIESAYVHLLDELEWSPKYAALATREARGRGAILMVGDNFRLTASGREWARDLAEQKRFMPA